MNCSKMLSSRVAPRPFTLDGVFYSLVHPEQIQREFAQKRDILGGFALMDA